MIEEPSSPNLVNHFRQQLLTLEATGVTRVLSSDLQAMSDFVMSLEENEKAEMARKIAEYDEL